MSEKVRLDDITHESQPTMRMLPGDGHETVFDWPVRVREEAPIADNGHGKDIAPAPQWSTTQKDAVYEFARFLQTKMGLAKPRIYIGYADEFFGDKPPR